MKNSDGKEIGQLTSFFYKNGYGGGILMQSTLPEHQADVWDRVGIKGNKNDDTNPSTFFESFDRKQSGEDNGLNQMILHNFLSSRINVVLLSGFCVECFASPPAQHRSISNLG